MATDFTINGTTASQAPYEQKWRAVQTGLAHDQQKLVSTNWEVDLFFSEASMPHARQWCELASAASANVTILNKYKSAYVDLSGIQVSFLEAPQTLESYAGPFSLTLRGVAG